MSPELVQRRLRKALVPLRLALLVFARAALACLVLVLAVLSVSDLHLNLVALASRSHRKLPMHHRTELLLTPVYLPTAHCMSKQKTTLA